jgi:hypothetical protein
VCGGHALNTGLDILGLIPIIGGLKIVGKVDDVGRIINKLDDIDDVAKGVGKAAGKADDIADVARGAGRTSQFKGKNIFQDNSLFNPKFVDKQGRSNLQRMQEGLAPIGYDGKSVNIHHIDQTNNGPLMEISGSAHTQHYGELHKNTGQSPSQIDRPAFNNWRNHYWEWRASKFMK